MTPDTLQTLLDAYKSAEIRLAGFRMGRMESSDEVEKAIAERDAARAAIEAHCAGLEARVNDLKQRGMCELVLENQSLTAEVAEMKGRLTTMRESFTLSSTDEENRLREMSGRLFDQVTALRKALSSTVAMLEEETAITRRADAEPLIAEVRELLKTCEKPEGE